MNQLNRGQYARIKDKLRKNSTSALSLLTHYLGLLPDSVTLIDDDEYKIKSVEFAEDGMDVGFGIKIVIKAYRRVEKTGEWSTRTTTIPTSHAEPEPEEEVVAPVKPKHAARVKTEAETKKEKAAPVTPVERQEPVQPETIDGAPAAHVRRTPANEYLKTEDAPFTAMTNAPAPHGVVIAEGSHEFTGEPDEETAAANL